jgi:hypothetical protein
MITQEELKHHLHYNPDTGIFTRKIAKNSNVKIGGVAGCVRPNGYIQIKINYKLYLAHRLAWLYVYGQFPDHQIDHINRNKSDNRLINLRAVTAQQNQWNHGIPKNNTTGYLGVSYYRLEKKYRARIVVNNKVKWLGSFDCPKIAYDAYLKAKAEMHVI